jgi:hypothetical protein
VEARRSVQLANEHKTKLPNLRISFQYKRNVSRLHDEINAREIHRQDSLQRRHPPKAPILVIGLRQITEVHKHIDEAKVALFLQQLGGDRAEGSHKVPVLPTGALDFSSWFR